MKKQKSIYPSELRPGDGIEFLEDYKIGPYHKNLTEVKKGARAKVLSVFEPQVYPELGKMQEPYCWLMLENGETLPVYGRIPAKKI